MAFMCTLSYAVPAVAQRPSPAAAAAARVQPLLKTLPASGSLLASRASLTPKRLVAQRFAVRVKASGGIETQGDAPGKAGEDRPTYAEESRTLVQLASTCFIATASKEMDGHPFGSIVDLSSDEQGRPLFAISTMSAHTRDLVADPRCSITVQEPGFQGIQDGRATLVGTCTKVPEAEEAACKETILKKHPEAFWVEFADFSVYRMDVSKVRYVGGFGRAGSVSAEQYAAAEADPIKAFTPMIAGHMNADHKDTLIAMLAHYASLEVEDASIVGMDKVGMDLKVVKGDDSWRQRLAFIYPATDRKKVKEVLVEMTKTANAAAGPAKEE